MYSPNHIIFRLPPIFCTNEFFYSGCVMCCCLYYDNIVQFSENMHAVLVTTCICSEGFKLMRQTTWQSHSPNERQKIAKMMLFGALVGHTKEIFKLFSRIFAFGSFSITSEFVKIAPTTILLSLHFIIIIKMIIMLGPSWKTYPKGARGQQMAIVPFRFVSFRLYG